MRRAPLGLVIGLVAAAGCPGYRLPPLPEGYGEPVAPTVLVALPDGAQASWLGGDDRRLCWAETGGVFPGFRCAAADGSDPWSAWPRSAAEASGPAGALYAAILARGTIAFADPYV